MFRQVRTVQTVNLRISGCAETACPRPRVVSDGMTAGLRENDRLPQSNGKENTMSNSNSSNRTTVPQAREALNRFKMEVANEIGVPLKEGYNGDLTSAQNGSVGGEMVRQMIRRQEEAMSNGSK